MTHSIKKGQYAMNPDYNITLARGNHPAPPDDCGNPQRCLFEWYNWLTRATHTAARPPVLHTFGMRLNDILPDDRRQELVRFLPNGEDRLAGTEHDGKDETRGYIALDWLIRTYTPTWLDLAGLTAEAGALRDLRRISDLAAARAAGPVVRDARSKANAAWAAAGLQGSAIALYDMLITGEWPKYGI